MLLDEAERQAERLGGRRGEKKSGNLFVCVQLDKDITEGNRLGLLPKRRRPRRAHIERLKGGE